MFYRNVDAVSKELVALLKDLSGSYLVDKNGRPIGEGEIAGIAGDVGMLALMAGSQRAHILVDTCAHGDGSRALSDRFECEGSVEVGFPVVVDLMLQPCLRRVGDGHEDTATQNVVVKGSFLPQR
jgi:hypothetical protein